MPYRDPEKNKRCIRAYAQAHPEEMRQYNQRERYKLRENTLSAYSPGDVPHCACCLETRLVFLTLDHINGNGAEERRESRHKGGTNQYRVLRRLGFPPGYRVLCWNCNAAFEILGVCPHSEEPDKPFRLPAERAHQVKR